MAKPRVLANRDWLVPLRIVDAIHSYLVDSPGHIYMDNNKQWLFILTRDLGMVRLVHDYSQMSKEEVNAFVIESISRIRDDTTEG